MFKFNIKLWSLFPLTKKKKLLDKYLPLKEEALKNLEDWLRVELTYSSNAIEGNTLTRIETAEVMEKGISAVISGKLLKIGELAKETSETIHTLRYWTKEGLLKVNQFTEGGYQLYSPGMIKRAKKIRRLQTEKRLTISEIKKLLKLES